MADATIPVIDDRITEIDALVFRGSTGQIPMTIEGRSSLESEANALMKTLAQALHEHGAGEYQELHDAREKIRLLTSVSAMSNRDLQLHPEPQPEIDALVDAACVGFSDGTMLQGQAGEMLAAVFGTVFVELPSEIPHLPPPIKQSIFRRIMGW